MDTLYSVAQVYGKDLYAFTPVPLTRVPQDGAKSFITIPAGDRVGEVYSYISPKPGRTRGWWLFYDENGNSYYAEHLQGRFSLSELRDQGSLSVKEQVEQEKKDKEGVKGTIERLFKWAVGFAVVAYAANSYFKNSK